jgi:hypothetical protein
MTVEPPELPDLPAPPSPTVRGELLEIAGWLAAAAAALLLAINGLATALLNIRANAHPVTEMLGMSTRQFERMGVNICGDPVGPEVIFWLRHGNVVQAAGGFVAAAAALAFFIALLLRRRRLALALLVLGILAILVPSMVGHHLDREFWHGPTPDFARHGWSLQCAPN